jgi:hypothetical protein
MLPDNELTEIEARCAAATPGPWIAGTHEFEPAVFPTTYAVDCPVAVCDPLHKDGDPAFIAHARTDIPLLLTHIREQGAELEAAKREAGELRAHVVALVRAAQEVQDDASEHQGFACVRWSRIDDLAEVRELASTSLTPTGAPNDR